MAQNVFFTKSKMAARPCDLHMPISKASDGEPQEPYPESLVRIEASFQKL